MSVLLLWGPTFDFVQFAAAPRSRAVRRRAATNRSSESMVSMSRMRAWEVLAQEYSPSRIDKVARSAEPAQIPPNHLELMIPILAVGGLVAVSAGQQCTQPQEPDFTDD